MTAPTTHRLTRHELEQHCRSLEHLVAAQEGQIRAHLATIAQLRASATEEAREYADYREHSAASHQMMVELQEEERTRRRRAVGWAWMHHSLTMQWRGLAMRAKANTTAALEQRDAARRDLGRVREALLSIASDQQHYCKHSILADDVLGTRYGKDLVAHENAISGREKE